MTILLNMAYLLGLCLGLPYVVVRIILEKDFWTRIAPRLRPIPLRRGEKPCIWVHSVSVGEVLAAQNLVDQLEVEFPQYEIAISTTTTTGNKVARKIFPNKMVFYFPLDYGWLVDRALDMIRPSAVILVELELWPNFVSKVKERKVPLIIVNGRISQKSFSGYSRLKFFFSIFLKKIQLFCVQTPEYARRFQGLGVSPEKVVITGNIKYDNAFTGDVNRLRDEVLKELHLEKKEIVLIAGSTHSGEEEVMLDIYGELRKEYPSLRLVLAPRHPKRLPDILPLIKTKGYEYCLKTTLDQGTHPIAQYKDKVIVIDTLGELSKIYAVGSVVFVGGSLAPYGGHNVLEPASLGRAVVVGPHNHNFKKIVEYLTSMEALWVLSNEETLKEAIRKLLRDDKARLQLSENARRAIDQNKGATQATLREIKKIFT